MGTAMRPGRVRKRESGHPHQESTIMTHAITSLAAFKRALSISSRWESRYTHLTGDPTQPQPQVSDWEEKEVVHIQSNAVAFSIGLSNGAIARATQNPKRNASWLWFPKSSNCAFAHGAVRITHQADPRNWREYRPLHQNPSHQITTHAVWAVAADTLCDGWSIGIASEDGQDYADVYLTRIQAEQELADLIRERLTLFIEDADSYGDLETALDCGFEVIEATMRDDGTVLIDNEVKGMAPPAIRLALTSPQSN